MEKMECSCPLQQEGADSCFLGDGSIHLQHLQPGMERAASAKEE